MSIPPLRDESQPPPTEPCILGLDSDAADTAFEVLTASTTRSVLSLIYEQPSTPTDIRAEVGTSLQTVHYHLEKLEDARLIEPAGVEYSENGTEMTLYVPVNEAVALFAGRAPTYQRLTEFFR